MTTEEKKEKKTLKERWTGFYQKHPKAIKLAATISGAIGFAAGAGAVGYKLGFKDCKALKLLPDVAEKAADCISEAAEDIQEAAADVISEI